MRNNLLILLAIALLGVFTNPPLEKHQKAIEDKVKSLKNLDGDVDGDTLKKLGALLGEAVGLNTMSKYLNNNVKIHDLKVLSLTKLKINGDYKTVGIGAFGKVFLFDDVKNFMDEKASEIKSAAE
ncbi:MAG: hypothetical protein ACI9IP_000640 [Arcticibacterium sp.]|jgi:hypothetical protein